MDRMDGICPPYPLGLLRADSGLIPPGDKERSAAIVAISRWGAALGARVRGALGDDIELYVERRFADGVEEAMPFDLPVRPLVGRLFGECENLVLMMPVGAAVRLLAAYIEDKRTDAAVVCVDDGGRYAVSLLSGHVGGADALAERVADAIGATAVITSASHVLETLSVDLLGSEFGWRIEASSAMVTRASAAVVNGEPVGVYQDAGERGWWDADKPLPSNLNICETVEGLVEYPNVLLISDRADVSDMAAALEPRTLVTYRPRSLVVGVGSRRGVGLNELEKHLYRTFAAFQLSINAIKCIATAELKRDETAIGMLAERLGVPVRYYEADDLNAMPGPSGPSESQRLLGVVGVAEPAALLASEGGEIVVPKVRSAAATLAVARIDIEAQDG